MTAVLIILAAIVLLIIGYVTYGAWLAKQWGVDPKRPTPAHTMTDGVDYVAAKPAVLMGHHFSSIAGAGPINGPIQAAVFGWVPVFLWCVFGGIFFGGVHDFGALFASVRHGGKSVGEIIGDTMGKKAKTLFLIFALLVLILVIASFVNVVAGTFMDNEATSLITTGDNVTGNDSTAMISMLFIVLAIIYGLLTNRAGMGTLPATIIGLVGVVGIVILGLNVGLAMNRTTWIVLIGLYITIASLVPVWILLQPRDYLSSYLLYAMMLIAVFGIVFAAISKSATFQVPAFTGWKLANGSTLFPALFITVACGACSGFHSLIASGTSAKQLDNEAHAKPIGYGAMLIESALGVISLIAVGMVFDKWTGADNPFGSPSAAFAGGIATMFGADTTTIYKTIYALLTLAVSVFALTSLDSGTRLSRYMFSELFLKDGEKSYKDATGIRKVLAYPLFGTLFMVVVGCVLGGLSLSQIWGLFGAANQLLAGLALMAVAAWLGNVGKNNKMFIFPMIFMLCATLTSLCITIVGKVKGLASGAFAVDPATTGPIWGHWFQLIFAAAMFVLAIILVIEGIQTFVKQSKKQNA
ncbi:MAG: carbon starvation protein A [Oscillospiraceae bacterium]|nr:carbon starvation protein A [Oscillospiraceae bacterium]